MKKITTTGAYGTWVKIFVDVDGKHCRRITGPNGVHGYDYTGKRGIVHLRPGNAMANKIDAAITAATAIDAEVVAG